MVMIKKKNYTVTKKLILVGNVIFKHQPRCVLLYHYWSGPILILVIFFWLYSYFVSFFCFSQILHIFFLKSCICCGYSYITLIYVACFQCIYKFSRHGEMLVNSTFWCISLYFVLGVHFRLAGTCRLSDQNQNGNVISIFMVIYFQ